jgi:hypothetical protein
MLKFIGAVTLTVAGATTGYLAILAIRSLPDIQRYMKIRSM